MIKDWVCVKISSEVRGRQWGRRMFGGGEEENEGKNRSHLENKTGEGFFLKGYSVEVLSIPGEVGQVRRNDYIIYPWIQGKKKKKIGTQGKGAGSITGWTWVPQFRGVKRRR